MTRGDKLAFTASKGAVVDGEVHFNGRFTDFDKGDRVNFACRADCVADGDVFNTAETDDIAHFCFGDGGAFQSFNLEEGDNLALVG